MTKEYGFAEAFAGRWASSNGHQSTFANAAEFFNSLLDGLLRLVVTDNIFVFWAAAGVHAGFSAQRTTGRDLRFTVLEGAFVQFGFEEIPVHPFEISEPEFVCPEFRVACALFQHFVSPWAQIRTCMLCRRRRVYCRAKADAGAATPNHSRCLWKTSPCNAYWRPDAA